VRFPDHQAALRIVSPHAGADLRVGGKSAGRTPIEGAVPVEPGRIHVDLRTESGSVAQEIDVKAGQIVDVTLALGAGPSRLPLIRGGLLGLGAVSLAISAAAAVAVNAKSRDVEASAAMRQPGSGLAANDYANVRGLDSDGRLFSRISIGALVAGVISLGAGAFLFLVDAAE
jgi:hypothetical protein